MTDIDKLKATNADLLAALQAIIWVLEYTSPLDLNYPHEMLIQARAAIKRAGEGGA